MNFLHQTSCLIAFTLICPAIFAAILPQAATAHKPMDLVKNPWSEVGNPSEHNAEIRGTYTAGCLHGAESLLGDQGDFQLMRLSRQRYYAHPHMRQFLKSFSANIRRDKLGALLVGDIGQPRGGPTLKGHASHQVGLDADVWFWLDSPASERQLSKAEREQLSAISMLNQTRSGINPKRFGRGHIAALKLAALDPKVQRIFVHPHIKQELCKVTGKAAWLRKIRPWWGHHYHFHVRLRCPPGQEQCRTQASVSPGPGCGKELAWWFTPEAAATLRRSLAKSRGKTLKQRLDAKLAKLPQNCADVLRRR